MPSSAAIGLPSASVKFAAGLLKLVAIAGHEIIPARMPSSEEKLSKKSMKKEFMSPLVVFLR